MSNGTLYELHNEAKGKAACLPLLSYKHTPEQKGNFFKTQNIVFYRDLTSVLKPSLIKV